MFLKHLFSVLYSTIFRDFAFPIPFNDKSSSSFFFFKMYSLPTVKDWPPSIVSFPETLFNENILLKSILLSESVSLLDLFGLNLNDAFGVSHRAHASVHAITNYFDNDHKSAGFLLLKEINFFHKLLQNPARPFVAVVGGSKVSGKLQALINLLPKVDKMIIGGGMAFTFLKAQGYEIGNSLVEDDLIDEANHIMSEAKINSLLVTNDQNNFAGIVQMYDLDL